MKNVQYHFSLGKCKLKPRDTIIYLLEWRKLKRLIIAGTDEDVEQLELSYTSGGTLWNIVWQFVKILSLRLPYDPAVLLLGFYP